MTNLDSGTSLPEKGWTLFHSEVALIIKRLAYNQGNFRVWAYLFTAVDDRFISQCLCVANGKQTSTLPSLNPWVGLVENTPAMNYHFATQLISMLTWQNDRCLGGLAVIWMLLIHITAGYGVSSSDMLDTPYPVV